MKVLHLINNLAVGGVEIQLLMLCRQFKKLGLEVIVAYLREGAPGNRSLKRDFLDEGIRVVQVQGGGRYDIRFPMHLARVLRTETPAVLHTHLPRPDWAGALARWTRPQMAFVSSVHDIHSETWAGKWTLPLCGWAWRRTDRIVAISETVRDWLVNEQGIPAARIVVIPYGIEIERYAGGLELRDSWGVAGRRLVGSIGRLEPRKGHDCLIRAMPTVLRTYPDACLVIAGNDAWGYRSVLERTVRELHLEQHVQFLGLQNDIPSFLRSIEVFAFASRAEGLGQVILEAMAAGKPIVANNIPPLREILGDPATGLLVASESGEVFGDAIVKLLRERSLANDIGRRAHERAANTYSIEAAAERISEQYRSLVHI